MEDNKVSVKIEDYLNRPLVIVYRVDDDGCTKCEDCAIKSLCYQCSLPSGYIFVDFLS